jgi:hypothetical protein
MRFLVPIAVLGWLVFQGAAVWLVLSVSVPLGCLAEVAAVIDGALLWLYGVQGGKIMINVTSTNGRKARG